MLNSLIALYGIGVVGYAIYPHLNLTGKQSQASAKLPSAKISAGAATTKKALPSLPTTGQKTHQDSHKVHHKNGHKNLSAKVNSEHKPKAKGPSEKSPH